MGGRLCLGLQPHLGSCYCRLRVRLRVRGPADELSAVIEFPCQAGRCHYARIPEVSMHHPPAHGPPQ